MSVNVDDLFNEGSRGIQDLCYLSEAIGYKDKYPQLVLNNGSAVSSLVNFLQDNPGAIQAIYDWVEDNYNLELESYDFEDSLDEDEDSLIED